MGKGTLRKGKLEHITSVRRGLVHTARVRPSAKTIASVRRTYENTRRQKLENAEARNTHTKSLVASIKREMINVKSIPRNRFKRSMFLTLSRHRCKSAIINGVHKYVSVYLGPHIKNEDKPGILKCIDYSLPIFKGIDSVLEMPDMGYLFVIGTTEEFNRDAPVEIYFQLVLSSLELGSQHATLVKRMGIKRVYAAGEMRKVGNHVDYNMLSGTFMVGFTYEKGAIDMTDAIFRSLNHHSLRERRMTVHRDDLGRPLIERDVVKGELLHAKRCGYSVEFFNDKDRCELDQRYQDAKKKGQGKAFLETRRNRMRNISADNVERALANMSKRLYEPNNSLH